MRKEKKLTDYTVSQLVERFKDRTLYLGAQSAYLWIGDGTEAKFALKVLDTRYKALKTKTVSKNERLRGWYQKRLADLNPKGTTGKEREKMLKEKETLEKRIETLDRSIADGHSYLDNWTPMLDRKVKDVYARSKIFDYDLRGVAIIMEGDEGGEYWDAREFENNPTAWLA